MEYNKLVDVCILNRFKELDASSLEEIIDNTGSVKLLPSSKDYDWFTTSEKAGDNLCNGEVITLGRARYANIKYWKGDFVSSNNVVVESFNQNILLTNYLFRFLDFHKKEFYIEGTTYPKFDSNIFKSKIIPIPSLEEQKEIVKLLDELNDAINKDQKELEKLDELVKSRFIEMFGDPVENDKGWETRKLNDVCPVNKYKGSVEIVDGKVWLLNLDMVESNTGRVIDYLYEDEDKVNSSTIIFDTNCVLYSKLRPYLNKVVVPDISGYATSEMISMNTVNVNRHFLATLLRTDSFVSFANGTAYGAKMPRASVDGVKNFDLIMPSKQLQDEFGTMVEQIDKSKFIIQKRIDLYKELLDKKMSEYFE